MANKIKGKCSERTILRVSLTRTKRLLKLKPLLITMKSIKFSFFPLHCYDYCMMVHSRVGLKFFERHVNFLHKTRHIMICSLCTQNKIVVQLALSLYQTFGKVQALSIYKTFQEFILFFPHKHGEKRWYCYTKLGERVGIFPIQNVDEKS